MEKVFRVLALALLILFGLGPPSVARGQTVSMQDYLPNWRIAQTHVLESADGWVHGFDFPAFPETPARFGKWLTKPGMGRCDPAVVTDWMEWTVYGLYGSGFDTGCARMHDWFVPPGGGVMPLMWDTTTPFVTTIRGYNVHVDQVEGLPVLGAITRIRAELSLYTMIADEPLIVGEAQVFIDDGRKVLHEFTLFSDCIPVVGGGCEKGIRRIVSLDPLTGAIQLDLTFVRWRAR